MDDVTLQARAKESPGPPDRTRPLRVASRLLAVTLGACLLLAACRDDDDDDYPSGGTVAQLTGDPDDEVTPELQAMVAEAVGRDPMGEPVDF